MKEGEYMTQPKPQTEKYNDLISDIRRGYMKIPKFQRDFVWKIEDTARLLDSILKGYPVGTFIIWKTRERMGSIKNIGDAELPPAPEGDSVKYVLDGQQRLASLYAVVEGLKVRKKGKVTDYKQIYVDLGEDIDSEEPIIVSEEPEESPSISLYDLLSKDIGYLVANFGEHLDKIEHYLNSFKTYDFSTVVLQDYSIDAAVEIFTRINTTGTELTLFEIMSAKTYDEAKGFDMQKKYAELQEELEGVGYDTIPSSTVLQSLSVNLEEDCRRKTILKLDKERIIDTWQGTAESIKEAIDHFKTHYRIPASRLLPYNALLVPFSYFFFTGGKDPDYHQERLLEEYLWRSSLSYRFTSGVGTKLGQDVKRMKKILKGDRPDYDFNISLNAEDLRDWGFSTGDSYCKAILCLLASFRPRAFNNNSDVVLDNSYLKRSNSRNYHHFFPRKYLKSVGIADDAANSIVNITFVGEYLNKGRIRAKPPSEYMGEFARENPSIGETMRTHLIDDMDEFGIWEDDYKKFLEKRSERIAEELQKKINS